MIKIDLGKFLLNALIPGVAGGPRVFHYYVETIDKALQAGKY
jgi:hypothetical protein